MEQRNGQQQTVLFERARKRLGVDFVPKIFEAAAGAPAASEGLMTMMEKLFAEGALSPALKQMMMVAISSTLKCRYTEALHVAICKNAGVTDEQLGTVCSEERPDKMANDWALVRFAVRVANTPQWVEPEEMQALAEQGIPAEQIAEALTVGGFGRMVTAVADALALDVDPQVSEMLAR